MSLISVLTQFADRLDNVINAARLTNGVNSLSHERVARARQMMLASPTTGNAMTTRTGACVAMGARQSV